MDFNQSYFDIFGLPAAFDLDLNLLSDRFLELQKEVHPDRFVNRTEQEKRLAMQWAALINSASDTLKSPLQRAIYLLRLRGVELAENPQLPPEFLMRQIELRERLEHIGAGAANLDELDGFRKEVGGLVRSLEGRFAHALNEDLPRAETLVYEMQFLNRLLTAANHLEEKLLDD